MIKTDCFAYLPKKDACSAMEEMLCEGCSFYTPKKQAASQRMESLKRRILLDMPLTEFDIAFLKKDGGVECK